MYIPGDRGAAGHVDRGRNFVRFGARHAGRLCHSAPVSLLYPTIVLRACSVTIFRPRRPPLISGTLPILSVGSIEISELLSC